MKAVIAKEDSNIQDCKIMAIESQQLRYPRIGLHIDGKWIYDRKLFRKVCNPGTEQLLGNVPRASPSDLMCATSAAQRGFELWLKIAPAERARIIKQAGRLLVECTEEIARTITLEQGKPLSESRADIMTAGSILEWNAEQSTRVFGCIMPAASHMQRHILKQPIGPIAAFVPWNASLSSPARMISSALGAGCSIVIKIPEEAPGSGVLLVKCFIDAGLPPGVLQLLYGETSEISSALISSPAIRMVTASGSVSMGKQLAKLAGESMKPLYMEVGGQGPVLIGEGVDASAIAQVACVSKMRMAGQLSTSPTRFLIHHSLYSEFVSSLSNAANGIRVGDGFEKEARMGPLINRQRVTRIEALVLDARIQGAKITAGGFRIGNQGHFFAPTVIADVPTTAKAMSEEITGPMALCVSVNDLDHALKIATKIPFGFSAYAFTNSMMDAAKISRELECGTLSINHFGTPSLEAPYDNGKVSGIAPSEGTTGLDAYFLNKTVFQRTTTI